MFFMHAVCSKPNYYNKFNQGGYKLFTEAGNHNRLDVKVTINVTFSEVVCSAHLGNQIKNKTVDEPAKPIRARQAYFSCCVCRRPPHPLLLATATRRAASARRGQLRQAATTRRGPPRRICPLWTAVPRLPAAARCVGPPSAAVARHCPRARRRPPDPPLAESVLPRGPEAGARRRWDEEEHGGEGPRRWQRAAATWRRG